MTEDSTIAPLYEAGDEFNSPDAYEEQSDTHPTITDDTLDALVDELALALTDCDELTGDVYSHDEMPFGLFNINGTFNLRSVLWGLLTDPRGENAAFRRLLNGDFAEPSNE